MEMPYAIRPEAYSHKHCDCPLSRSVHDKDCGSSKRGQMA